MAWEMGSAGEERGKNNWALSFCLFPSPPPPDSTSEQLSVKPPEEDLSLESLTFKERGGRGMGGVEGEPLPEKMSRIKRKPSQWSHEQGEILGLGFETSGGLSVPLPSSRPNTA